MKMLFGMLVSLMIGIAIGAYSTRDFMGNMMLHGMYTDQAADAKLYLALLEIQAKNDQAKLTKTIEQFLSMTSTVLQGCERDLCKNKELTFVNETLLKIKLYESESTNL